MGFTTAAVIQEQRGDVIQITTGCKELDNILEGEEAACGAEETSMVKPLIAHLKSCTNTQTEPSCSLDKYKSRIWLQVGLKQAP